MNEVIDLARGKRVPFRVMRGQVIDIAVSVTNSDGTPYDFTGHTAEMLVYNSFNKTDSTEYEVDVTLSLGVMQFDHEAITRKKEDFVYQLWITDDLGYRQIWTNGPFLVLNSEVNHESENADLIISPSGDNITISVSPISLGTVARIYSKTVELTSANILALNSTKIDAINAPGANKYISPIQLDYIYTFGTIAYTRNSSAAMNLYYDGITASAMNIVGSVLTQSNDAVAVSGVGTAFLATTKSLVVNKKLQIGLNAGSFTLGNGTLKVKILYQIIDI